MKKISFVLFLMFLFVGFSNAQKNQRAALEQYSQISYKIVINGDAISSVRNNSIIPNVKSILGRQTPPQYTSPLYNTTFIFTGCTTIYDLVSNATPQNIIQDPGNPNRIHIVCMYSPQGDPSPSFPGRRSKYYYSTNTGSVFYFLSDAPYARSGYPIITLAPNGNALIGNHNTNVTTVNSVHFYYDAAPGLGSFTELFPTQYMDYIWPRVAFTNSLTNTNKFISVQTPNGRDSCFLLACTSLSPSPGTFSAWNFINSDQAETYSIARGSDGRIGIVYKANEALTPADYGDVFFIESTNHGVSFSSPLKIYNANISPVGDSVGSLRGIQLVYQGSISKVAFEVSKQTTAGSYFPNGGANHIRFWSSSLPGSDPNRSIKIADTSNVGYHPYVSTGTAADVFTCICRPTIGVSADGTGLFVAFMVPSDYVGGYPDTVSFMDVWIMYSTNSGSNWIAPVKINPVSPIRDWTFPCISPANDNNSNNYYANILVLSDSIPGSFVNHSGNSQSLARYMLARVELPKNPLPPTAPTLIYPVNGTTGVPQPITFDWSDVPGATSYRLQIALNSTFTTLVVDVTSGVSEYTLFSGALNSATTYYWRVNASGPGGTGQYSAIWSFTTGTGNPPPAPILLSPPNGATCVSLTPMLDWQNATGATSYRVQVSISPTFETTVINVSGLPASQYTVNANVLTYNTQYYWRVNASNQYGTSPWSNTLNFTTTPPAPPPPVLIAPPNGATNMPLTPMLYWSSSSGAMSYSVQLSMSSSFTSIVYDTIITTTQILIPPGRLINLTVYYWRVLAINSCGALGAWSAVWVFVTNPTGINTYSAEIPTEYKLHNNFPNPFNPATKIRFDLPKVSDTKLIIYNILGKELATLINEKLPPGKFEIEWNASSLPSGIYFYKLETENFVDVKKLVLIK
ncbi:MAG: T9SS type A sorting domain-containing protein [Ignavibacteriae bacterium]|nr:T9SS type A sorting domain-containing protein [Ignavibacteriota bacterium]